MYRLILPLLLALITLVIFCIFVDSLMKFHAGWTMAGTDALAWWTLCCVFAVATILAWPAGVSS